MLVRQPTESASDATRAADAPRFSVRTCRLSDGERLPLVVDRRGIPVPLPNQYALFLRREQLQATSLEDELRTLAHVYDWADRRALSFEDRLSSGNGLTPDEIALLYQNLRYSRGFGRANASKRLVEIADPDVVSPNVHYVRVCVARDFLVWAMDRALYSLDVNDSAYGAIRERRDRIERMARDFKRSATPSSRRGLPSELRTRLLEIISPTYTANPFNKPVRFRNWLLISMLLTFGFRRGETLKIYVSDVNLKGRYPTLVLQRRPDDPNDPRIDEPHVKTLGREIPLIKEMAKLLNEYIQFHRPKFPNADCSPFLFFSSRGLPLSLRQINDALDQVCRRFPEFRGQLSPHVLRHTYNDMLVSAAETAGLGQDALRQAQNYLNGWRLTSSQGDAYTRRSTEEHARIISLEHQRALFA